MFPHGKRSGRRTGRAHLGHCTKRRIELLVGLVLDEVKVLLEDCDILLARARDPDVVGEDLRGHTSSLRVVGVGQEGRLNALTSEIREAEESRAIDNQRI